MGLGPFDSLIFPVVAIIQRVDMVATEAAAGYNHRFREPVLTDSGTDGIGESTVVLGAEIEIPCQVENSRHEDLSPGQGGDLPETSIILTMSRTDLKALSLIGTDGRVGLRPGADRLIRIENEIGEKLRTFNRPPGGLYLTEAKPADAYLGNTANFILATFEDRPRGPKA